MAYARYGLHNNRDEEYFGGTLRVNFGKDVVVLRAKTGGAVSCRLGRLAILASLSIAQERTNYGVYTSKKRIQARDLETYIYATNHLFLERL